MKTKWLLLIISSAVLVIITIGYFFLRMQGINVLSVFNMGSDLTGGTRLLLRVETDDALTQELGQDAARIGYELQSRAIAFAAARKGAGFSVDITGVDPARNSDVRLLCDQLYAHKYTVRSAAAEGRTTFSLSLLPDYVRQMRESAVQQTSEVIHRRLSSLGIRRAVVRMAGDSVRIAPDQIVVELPKMDNLERVADLIVDTAQLALCLVKKENGGPFPNVDLAVQGNGGKIPEGYKIVPFKDDGGGTVTYLVVSSTPTITGKDLKNARRGTDSQGRPNIDFFLNAAGAELFGRATGQHIGDRLAIVLDNTVYSAPEIQSRIGAEGQITGSFTVQQAEDLALLLRSGALPASVTVLERSIISPKGKTGN